MMQKILVEVGYYDFWFTDIDKAVAFATAAVNSISEADRKVTLKVDFTNGLGEVIAENGED